MRHIVINAVCSHCHKELKAHVGLKPEMFQFDQIKSETIKPIIVVEPHDCEKLYMERMDEWKKKKKKQRDS